MVIREPCYKWICYCNCRDRDTPSYICIYNISFNLDIHWHVYIAYEKNAHILLTPHLRKEFQTKHLWVLVLQTSLIWSSLVQLAWRDACLEIAPANVKVGDVGRHDLYEFMRIWSSTICARKFFIMCQCKKSCQLGGKKRMKFADTNPIHQSINPSMSSFSFSGVYVSTFWMRWTLDKAFICSKKCLLIKEG